MLMKRGNVIPRKKNFQPLLHFLVLNFVLHNKNGGSKWTAGCWGFKSLSPGVFFTVLCLVPCGHRTSTKYIIEWEFS